MKTSRYYLLPATLGLLLLSGGPTFAQRTDQGTTTKSSQEQTVDVSEVPQPAREAAQKALGTAPTSAKVIIGTAPQEYELTAKNKSGKRVKVHVLADGTIMKKGKPEREARGPGPTPH